MRVVELARDTGKESKKSNQREETEGKTRDTGKERKKGKREIQPGDRGEDRGMGTEGETWRDGGQLYNVHTHPQDGITDVS